MSYWRYKAYNSELAIYEGIIAARNFSELAIKLRQRGMQVVEATTTEEAVYIAEKRKLRQQKIINKNKRT